MLGELALALGAVHHVDALHRHTRSRQQRVREGALAPREREYRAVVIRVRVDIQQPRVLRHRLGRGQAGREGLGDRLDGTP